MAIDREKYITKYVDEGLEIIALVEGLVFDIKDDISVDDDMASLMRALHTLKGTSRMLEFKRIEDITHALENVFIALKERRINLTENAVKLTLAVLDIIKRGLGLVQHTKDDSIDIKSLVIKLNALAANEEYTLPEETVGNKGHVTKSDASTANKEYTQPEETKKKKGLLTKLNTLAANAATAKGDTALSAEPTENTQSPKAAPDKTPSNTAKNLMGKTSKDAKSDSIRLSVEKIDGIIKSIASLQSLEIAAKSISRDSAALTDIVKEFSVKFNEILREDKNRAHSLAENFRKLERLSERVNSALKNYSVDTGNTIRNAYDTVILLRTLPLSTIFDSYPRYVYELSSALGKKVHLTIEGKENEIDKNIIESLSEIFMHMVRNSIDHGIETPENRIAAGKSETGKLSIVCSQESGNMKIVISDDGQGIDHEKIREKLVREGFVTAAAAAAISKEELIHFIFQSGFSTSGKVSNVSGRGVGLDVVRESIETLKGSIIVDSVLGNGTVFTIMVPLSIAALKGFPVVSGGMKFIIPATFVETILLVGRDEVISVVDRPEIKYNDRLIKIYYLSQLLQIKTEFAAPSDIVLVLIIRAYDNVVALAVDNIASMRSVILKTMPAFMENMPIFSGIVLNEDYEMVSVLHIPTVIKMAKRVKTIDLKKRTLEFENLRKSILVVDDSLPTREIEKEILEAEGYFVDTAENGAEALKAAKSKHYDLICTDINMPVMDGLMLVENIRKNEELSNIPIIVISSMASEDYQTRAAMLGASRYIVKNSFNNHNLLEAVKDLIGKTGVQ